VLTAKPTTLSTTLSAQHLPRVFVGSAPWASDSSFPKIVDAAIGSLQGLHHERLKWKLNHITLLTPKIVPVRRSLGILQNMKHGEAVPHIL
jgi:hypothetical protein